MVDGVAENSEQSCLMAAPHSRLSERSFSVADPCPTLHRLEPEGPL